MKLISVNEMPNILSFSKNIYNKLQNNKKHVGGLELKNYQKLYSTNKTKSHEIINKQSTVVIVESPTKADKLQSYLGKEYKVIASMGHICGFERKKEAVIPEKDFQLKWELSESGEKQIKLISQHVSKCNKLVLATDMDREGEGIAWHITEYLKKMSVLTDQKIERVTFFEITKNSILKAMETPRDIDENLVGAYLSRATIDFLVGFTLSPILWKKVPSSKSAGRVQSAALRLICEREEEIANYQSRRYFSVHSQLWTQSNCALEAILTHIGGEKLDLKKGIQLRRVAENYSYQIKEAKLKVTKKENSIINEKPLEPFNTATLQQEASRRLRFVPTTTMSTAQKLYEGADMEGSGLITYMRTDSVTISDTAIEEIRNTILKKYGKEYLPEKPKIYKTKAKNVQEAHEAIRPTNMNITKDDLPEIMSTYQKYLYDLIWRRTMASQMEDAKYERIYLTICDETEKLILYSSVRYNLFKGHYLLGKYIKNIDDNEDEESDFSLKQKKKRQLNEIEKKDFNMINNIKEGEVISHCEPEVEEHHSRAPGRYRDASIISTLKDYGIGRPSTYAIILRTLAIRDYAKKIHIGYKPSALGLIVNEFFKRTFSKFIDYGFTSELEEKFDAISNGEVNWKEVTREFWEFLSTESKKIEKVKASEVIEMANQNIFNTLFKPLVTDERTMEDMTSCPSCGDGKLMIKLSYYGPFLGCSNYYTKQCKYTRTIGDTKLPSGDPGPMTDNKILHSLGKDPKSGRDVYIKLSRFGVYLELDHENSEFVRTKSLSGNLDIHTFTLERALEYLEPLKDFGYHPITGYPLTLERGRKFNSIRHGTFKVSIPRNKHWTKFTKANALELLKKNEPKQKYKNIPIKKNKKSAEDVEVKIKKPRSAYIFYIKENKELVKTHNPGISTPELIKIMAKQWKSLDAENMEIYKKLAEKDKERYTNELDTYTFAINNNDIEMVKKFEIKN